ncbi:MAG: MFS transporter [Chloroflexota bacterium]
MSTSDLARPRAVAAAAEAASAAAATHGTKTALIALGCGAYMSALGQSVVNAILPIVTESLGAEVATTEWVVVVFMLIQSGFLLSFGRLGDLRGHRRIYTIGLYVFFAGSLLCGLAPSAEILIAARIPQAIGGSMCVATSAAILTRVFPPSQRGRAMGFQASAVYLGLATGPPLGGWLTMALGWRAVFLVNVPVSLVVLVLTRRFVPADAPRNRGETFDRVGAAAYLVGLTVLLLAMNRGHEWGWISPITLGCLLVGACVMGIFAAIELRVASPMLNLGLFRRRAFTLPVMSTILNYMGVSSTFFLMPFYLLQGRGIAPSTAGFILTAQPIVMAATASLSGALSDRVGSRIPGTIGMAVLSIGLFLLSRAGSDGSLAYVVGSLALVGLGIGLFTSPNSSAVMGAVPREHRGVASGILATSRMLGNVLGFGVAAAIFNTVLHREGQTAAAIVAAAGAGLTVASVITAIGAVTTAARPAQDIPG